MDYEALLMAGFGGGAVRGLVGFVKHQFAFKNGSFELGYFLAMMFVSGVVGLLTTAAISELGLTFFGLGVTPAIAFIAGYAGGDFLENLYKILFRQVTFRRR